MICLIFTKPREDSVCFDEWAEITKPRGYFTVIVRHKHGSRSIGDDITVSNRHARIFLKIGKYYIKVLSSGSITKINGVETSQLCKGRAESSIRLMHRDIVEVGLGTKFQVEISDERDKDIDENVLIQLEKILRDVTLDDNELDKTKIESLYEELSRFERDIEKGDVHIVRQLDESTYSRVISHYYRVLIYLEYYKHYGHFHWSPGETSELDRYINEFKVELMNLNRCIDLE